VSASAGSDLDELIATSEVVVCTGAGGVGKTTTAAAIALRGARAGRRAVVVTIDPAKRLADALGLAELTNEPAPIDGPWKGELSALMLDTKTTFDELITRNARDAEHAAEILDNPFYRNISGAMSGSQEFMAMEKLHRLQGDDRFDLIVVDTPPSRSALDFLDAPNALTRFLDHRLYRVLTAPSRGIAKAVGSVAQQFLRTLAKVVGAAVIDDVIAFFSAFDGIEHDFRERADEVVASLSSDTTAFVLVASPKRETVSEAEWFAARLAQNDIVVRALVVNRMHPRVRATSAAKLRALATEFPDAKLGDHLTNAASFTGIAEREDGHLEDLAATVAPAPVVRVPMLSTDVHDLEGLATLSKALFGP
jgi:anion-transporting  ArsA/GET3 family ATPase